MARLFHRHPEAFARTIAIADACRFSLDELRYEYPLDPIAGGRTPQEELERLAWAGADERYPRGVLDKVRAQIAHELFLINSLDFAPYPHRPRHRPSRPRARHSLGVFQVESRAQMSMLPRLKPHCFYGLVVQVAIVRPGPIQDDKLTAEGYTASDRLPGIPHGRRIRIAGIVTIRQRPGSANGVIFITIEDETGPANVIVWPRVARQYRKVVLGARLLGVKGPVQRARFPPTGRSKSSNEFKTACKLLQNCYRSVASL